ncbi:hypothetical protein ACTOV4_00595 [Brucella sp. C7-11G]
MKKPEEDPELKRQRELAEREKIDAVREQSALKTSQTMRLYGARSALSGSGSSLANM